MANTKITSLTELAANPSTGDWVPIVDVSDTTMAATGTTKKLSATRYFTNTSDINTTGVLGSSWVSVTYNTGWVDFGGGHWGTQYKKFGDIVMLRGACKRTSGSSFVMFTLPAGFRPPGIMNIPVFSNGAGGMISVGTTGAVTLDVGGTANVFLNGAWFTTSS